MSDTPVNSMNVKQLRGEVQSLRDELAIMKRKFDDILYNLDDENFSSRFIKEKDNMKTTIEITANGIKTKVSKTDLETSLSNYSTLSQTAEAITSHVARQVSLSDAVPIEDLSDRTDKTKLYKYQEKDDDYNVINETYYFYNILTQAWEITSGNCIYSMFEQTANGFKLKGNTVIDGSVQWIRMDNAENDITNIANGEYNGGTFIDGRTVVSPTIRGGNIYGGKFWNSDETAYLILGYEKGNYADLTLVRADSSKDDNVFKVQDEGEGVSLSAVKGTFLTTSGYDTYLYGKWDFKDAIIQNLKIKFA